MMLIANSLNVVIVSTAVVTAAEQPEQRLFVYCVM